MRQSSSSVRRLYARFILLIGDLAAILISLGLLKSLRHEPWFTAEIVTILLAVLPLYTIVSFNNGVFALEALQRWKTGASRALISLALTTLLLLGLGFLLKISADYSRIVLGGSFSLAALLVMLFRYIEKYIIASLFTNGMLDIVLLVDGVDQPYKEFVRQVNVAELALRPTLDSPQMLDRIGKTLSGCDRVILCCPPEKREPWAVVLKCLGNEVQILTPEFDVLGILGITRFDDQLATVIAWGQLRMSQKIMKRAFDLAFVLFCFPILVFITVTVAFLIKLDDGGSVFFRQQRIGQGNQLFLLIKFRSMSEEHVDETGKLSVDRNDKRVTAIGKWLRRTSIDEIPQLFNVLAGTMSIVGPRPHALGSTAEDLLFWDVDQRYWLRHAIKPGLTGLAQVRGFRGATAETSDLTNRIQADLEYMVGWKLWRDIKIVLGTIKVILHPNAF